MKNIVALFLLSVAFTVHGKSLFAINSDSIPQGLDFRGRYSLGTSAFSLVVADESPSFGGVLVGELSEEHQAFVVELSAPDFVFSSKFEHSHCASGRVCVVIVQKTQETEFLSKLPLRADVVSLPTQTVVPPVVFAAQEVSAAVPVIADVISKVSETSLRDFLLKLTSINTRQSQSIGAVEASALLASTFRTYGFNVTTANFRNGYSDNVIAERRGQTTPSKIVIVGAHYDCRGQSLTSTTARAPGANDDGSGVAALAEIARVLSSSNMVIPYTIRLIAFSGEEQGLYGSTAYADAAKASKMDIVAMLQADMIGYQSGANPRLEFASRYATLTLNDQLTKLAALYVPGLAIGTTTSCCSDQQPFFSNGFAAAAYNEGGGYTIDPQYHNIGDVVDRNGYSIPQIKAITQCLFSAALTLANVA